MSRVGKYPVALPQGVTAEIKGQTIAVKGKMGSLSIVAPDKVEVKIDAGKVVVSMREEDRHARMLWGTTRNNINNMVKGVAEGFKESLEMAGVGFRAAVTGKDLVLQIGFSHEVKYNIPEGVTVKVEKGQGKRYKADKTALILVTGIDRQKVGQVAAEIRGLKKPEPYAGKGIAYADEKIRTKEGKKK